MKRISSLIACGVLALGFATSANAQLKGSQVIIQNATGTAKLSMTGSTLGVTLDQRLTICRNANDMVTLIAPSGTGQMDFLFPNQAGTLLTQHSGQEIIQAINNAGSSFTINASQISGLPSGGVTSIMGGPSIVIGGSASIPTVDVDGPWLTGQINGALAPYSTTAQMQSYVTGLGYQTAANVSSYVSGLGYQTASDVSTYVTGLGLMNTAGVNGLINTALAPYSTTAQMQTYVTGLGYQNATQVNGLISTALGAYSTTAQMDAAILAATTGLPTLANFTTLSNTVAGHTTLLNTHTGQITQLQSDLSALTTTVGNNNTTHTNNYNTLNNALTTLQSTVNTLNTNALEAGDITVDSTLSKTGSVALGMVDLGATVAGSFTNANITVDRYGRVRAVSNGSAGSGGGSAVYSVTGTDFQTTSSSLVDVTDMSFSIGANEVYQFEYNLLLATSNGTGLRVGVTAPSGAVVGGQIMSTDSSTTNGRAIIAPVTGGEIAFTLYQVQATNGTARIVGVVKNGSTAGSFKLQLRRANTGNVTVRSGSNMVARKLN